MRTDLFDFDLPADSIALRPANPRDSARMLVVLPDGVLRDRVVADLPQWLEPGDQLVVNDTKVIAAQLKGRRIGRDTEPKIEATLIKRLDGSRWQALVRPAKKLSQGDVVRFGNEGRVCLLGHLDAQVEHKGDDGEVTLSFSFHGPALDQAIADLGSPPLPPYIASKRTPDERDAADYQTMFAANDGAVATTSLRLLESATAQDGTIEPFSGETAIFITPGYRFRAVDILLTNFHLPRSTLFMLVSAFSGLDTMKRAYAHAIPSGYRFYSYGDACLLFRA